MGVNQVKDVDDFNDELVCNIQANLIYMQRDFPGKAILLKHFSLLGTPRWHLSMVPPVFPEKLIRVEPWNDKQTNK